MRRGAYFLLLLSYSAGVAVADHTEFGGRNPVSWNMDKLSGVDHVHHVHHVRYDRFTHIWERQRKESVICGPESSSRTGSSSD